MTATQELVVPKSIPMTSFPAGLALHEENKVKKTMIHIESSHTAREPEISHLPEWPHQVCQFVPHKWAGQ